MPHFLFETKNIIDNKIVIKDKELYNHLIKVRRTKIGENLLFLDENEIQYETVLKEISSNEFVCEIQKSYQSNRKLDLNLYVAQSVLNSDDQVSSIQKATELGVKGIIPLHTDNCAVKESFIKNKIEKWQKIAIESVKQCERADIPKVFDLAKLEDIIKDFDYVIVFAERDAQSDFFTYAKRDTDKNFFDYVRENKIEKDKSILIVIGPEGGFSQREFDFFKKKNLPLITLGNLIYRADTALTAALTLVINGVKYAQ